MPMNFKFKNSWQLLNLNDEMLEIHGKLCQIFIKLFDLLEYAFRVQFDL